MKKIINLVVYNIYSIITCKYACDHSLSDRLINPLLPNGNYSYRIIKISFSKKEGIKKKISYEWRVYESVDDESLS